jgi:DNA ligase-1
MGWRGLMSRLLSALLLSLALIDPSSAAISGGQAPAILLANVYRPHIDVARYLVSEKLEGVRALWDGQALRFRSGRPLHAPAWFIAGLPKQALDGELWAGRGNFERLSGTVRKERPNDAEWREVRYMIFELPGTIGFFTEGAVQIETIVRLANVLWLGETPQFRVAHRNNLQKKLDEIVRDGDKGLVLHLADASYQTNRSDILLKLKSWLDEEAEVIADLPSRGKYTGQHGALRVRTQEGKEILFGSGFTDRQGREPPALGSSITYPVT